MNSNSFPIINNDNHNKSTHDLLHHIILNNSVLSDKFKSLTFINNTINYNSNINNYNNYLLKDIQNKKNLNISTSSYNKNKKNINENIVNEYNNDIVDENDSFEINKSISS